VTPGRGREDELLLLLSRTSAARRAASERILQLARDLDYDRLTRQLIHRRLLPLLGGRLRDLAGDDRLPAPFVAAVQSTRRSARAAALAMQVETAAAVAALADAGIAALPLKGPGLAQAAHGDIGLRQSSDIDLLVRTEQLPGAVARLAAAGYGPPEDRVDHHGLPPLHFKVEHPERTPIEVHWRLHWYERRFSSELLERSELADEAAALLLFYARDGFYGLRLAADIAAWWDRHGAELGPAPLDGHAARFPELARAWWAAALVAERIVGVPAGAWFSDMAEPDRRARLAMRLANWSQSGDRDQLAANMALIDALLSPASSLPFVLRREMRSASGPAAPHAAKTGARWLAAAWLGRREPWTPLPTSAA
jgi:hypothetical protein